MQTKIFVKLLLLILFIANQSNLYAQKEGNIWYFGNLAGIDFNGTAPVVLTNGALNTNEGCATICDTSGSLLFYSDGTTIWNKNHTIMPNGTGLTGNGSSTQSVRIVKKPGSNTIYYVFTVDAMETNLSKGFRYSEVDMSLQNGLGDVNTNKNVLIDNPTGEKITVIKHQNNTDYWILTHPYGSNVFHAYLLTSSGLNMSPSISNIGSVISGLFQNTIGYLKVSPDGRRVATVNSYTALYQLELFDFDNSTGLLSNMIGFNGIPGGPYGVEFSPNSNLLYVSSFSPSKIYQYNLLAPSNTAIQNSRTVVGYGIGQGGALQLAPDNRIYYAQLYEHYLGVISNPDLIGSSCIFVDSGFYLAGRISTYGLPAYYNPIHYEPILIIKYFCYGDSTSFNISDYFLDSVSWDFGDINSGVYNFSKVINPKHVFSDTGSFTINLVYYSSGITDTIIENICIKPVPNVNLGNDTNLCNGENLILDVSTPYSTYLWHDLSINPTFIVNEQGMYWVEVTNNCGTSSDTINIDLKDCEIAFEMPNIFTPNADGFNDFFMPKEMKNITDLTIEIYNIWGQKMYETKSASKGWDGKFEGKNCADGTYYWIARYSDINGKEYSVNGFLTMFSH